MWKFSSVCYLWICLWWTWSEQGQYGLSWHQFDIATAPFCPATSRLVFVRSCQLKSSVSFWLLMCHYASPTQMAAQKRPQPCIYPKACLRTPLSPPSHYSCYKSRRVHGWAYHPKSFCRWRQAIILNLLHRIAIVFTCKVWAHSTLNPSPCCRSSDLCPSNLKI